MEINQLFKNTYVISLPHRIDRQESVKKEIGKLPIFYSFYEGINGHESNYNGPLLKGEYGVKATHIEILKRCIEENLESCFIFEDDVELHENILEELERSLQNIPSNVDMLYLGASHHVKPDLIKDNVYKVNHSYCAHAVFINKSVFKLLKDSLIANENLPLDVIYAIIQPNINAYAIFPHLAWQKNTYSDIQNKFIDYEFLKREFVRFEKN